MKLLRIEERDGKKVKIFSYPDGTTPHKPTHRQSVRSAIRKIRRKSYEPVTGLEHKSIKWAKTDGQAW